MTNYFLYIGDAMPCPLNQQFVLATEDSLDQITNGNGFDGKVIAKRSACIYELERKINSYVNPVYAMKTNLFPVFVKVSLDWVKSQYWESLLLENYKGNKN